MPGTGGGLIDSEALTLRLLGEGLEGATASVQDL